MTSYLDQSFRCEMCWSVVPIDEHSIWYTASGALIHLCAWCNDTLAQHPAVLDDLQGHPSQRFAGVMPDAAGRARAAGAGSRRPS